MEDREIEEIAAKVSKSDKKAILPASLLSLLLAVSGWVYSAGVLRSDVNHNTKELDSRVKTITAVPVLSTKVEQNQKTLETHTEQLEQLKNGQTEIKVFIESLR
jgi:hypothetical protein